MIDTPQWRDIFMPLRAAKREYEDTFTGYYEPSTQDFVRWLDVNYGIKLTVAEDDFNLRDTLEVVDEQKYLIFVLKYVK
jgi:hypothetical protein